MSEEKKELREGVRVVDKSAVTKKRGGLSKFTDTFIKGDLTTVIGHLVEDILIPSAIDLLGDMCHSFVDGMIYRDEGGYSSRRSGSKGRRGGYTSYSKSSSSGGMKQSQKRSGARRRSLEFDDILFDERGQAVEVLNILRTSLDENNYGSVSVGDFYDAYEEVCDIRINYDFTEEKYGWTDLDDVPVVPTRTEKGRKFYIKFPRAEYLAD